MCHTVHLRVLNTVGRHPESPDEIVVSTAVGCPVERIRHHHHHLIPVALRPRLRKATGRRSVSRGDESQRIAEEGVERLHAVHQVVKVEGHRFAIKQGRVADILSEAALPHEDKVVGLSRAIKAPLRGVGLQVHLPQVLRDVDPFVLRLQTKSHKSAYQ